MVADGGANFGPEMTVLANSFKTRFGLRPGADGSWQPGEDTPFIYTLPSKALAPKITAPAIKGKSTAVTIADWLAVDGVIAEVVK